jgi:hypothetical protein
MTVDSGHDERAAWATVHQSTVGARYCTKAYVPRPPLVVVP